MNEILNIILHRHTNATAFCHTFELSAAHVTSLARALQQLQKSQQFSYSYIAI